MSLFRRCWLRWVQGRLPPGRRQRLSRRSLFVLPTPLGMGYLFLCVVLYVFASNYQNNLILALSCLLLSLFVSATLVGFFNLAGLIVTAGPGHSRSAGQAIPFELTLVSKRLRYQIVLEYQDGPSRQMASLANQSLTIQLPHPSHQRGQLKPGRLCISSLYPLGLCRIWTELDMDQSALVWPSPQPCSLSAREPGDTEIEQSRQSRPGIDSFQGLGPWQRGESLSRIAWKQAARGGKLQSKRFETPLGRAQLLGLEAGQPLEQALSRLAWQLQTLDRQHQPFGLELSHSHIPLGQGQHHLKRCLDCLASYPEAQ